MISNLTVANKTKGKPPRLPFLKMKEKVLGKNYILDVTFVTPATSLKLNKQYRGINKPTDILSFPLSPTEGAIVIDLTTTKKMASEFNRSYSNFIGFLFIHGLVHLKGFDHGSRMENVEKSMRTYFGI